MDNNTPNNKKPKTFTDSTLDAAATVISAGALAGGCITATVGVEKLSHLPPKPPTPIVAEASPEDNARRVAYLQIIGGGAGALLGAGGIGASIINRRRERSAQDQKEQENAEALARMKHIFDKESSEERRYRTEAGISRRVISAIQSQTPLDFSPAEPNHTTSVTPPPSQDTSKGLFAPANQGDWRKKETDKVRIAQSQQQQ